MKIPIQLGATLSSPLNVGSSAGMVYANNGAIYVIYTDANSDLVYKKSTNGGFTWSNPIAIFVGSVWQAAVWYGRWSDRTDDKIYMAYSETATDDILFRTIDTGSSDALGTQTVVLAGASTAAGGCISITVAKGGNVHVAGFIDAGAEGGGFKSTDGGATWGSITSPMEGVSGDQIFLMPGMNAGDTQDVMGFFTDGSSNALSVKRYDDSADTWTETSIGSVIDVTVAIAFPYVAGAVDIANNQIVVVAWNETGAAGQDLQCWTVNWTTVTAKTNVVTDADACQNTAISIDVATGTWYAFWDGNPNGSETLGTAVNIWYSTSTDAGTTWSTARQLTPQMYNIKVLYSSIRIPSKGRHWPIGFVSLSTSGEYETYTLADLYAASGGIAIVS